MHYCRLLLSSIYNRKKRDNDIFLIICAFFLHRTAELFKSWLRSVLPYSCTIIKRSMLMINYAYRRVCRWTNVAHKEATYCTELMADWIRSSCIAICLRCFKQHCNPKSRSFPHDQQTVLTSHKVNLHFGDMVPPFPAKLTRSDCFCHTAFQIDKTGWWRWWWWWWLSAIAVAEGNWLCAQMKRLTRSCKWLSLWSHGSIISVLVSTEFLRSLFTLTHF